MLLLTLTVLVSAQGRKITGHLLDSDTKEPMAQATVQLLRTDSTFAVGALTDEQGRFSVVAPADGKYIVRMSSIGYRTTCHNVTLTGGKDIALGDLPIKADAISLKGTTITGHAAKVTLSKDTFVYNAAAYRTPEGSTIEELVKRLPGAEVDDDGKITINGKEVKKIKIDGKEFMTGDTKTAMKNLPTSIVNKVKAYNEKSDLTRITGIDDGNEQTVLDFNLKEGMNRGSFANADLSYGTHDRYAERLMGAYFNSKLRTMAFGSANNTNDMGFPGGGGRGRFGRGRNGLNASKMLGGNINYDDGTHLQLDGSLRWNHSDGDARVRSSSENFVSSAASFSNSLTTDFTRSDSWNAQVRLEWSPDSLTNILFRPTMSLTTSDSRSSGMSGAYGGDPYEYVSDPLSLESMDALAERGLMVNRRENTSIGYSDSKRFGGSLQFNRRLSSLGRNVTLRLEANYTDGTSKNLSTSNIHLYQVTNTLGNDSTYQTNRYSLTPTRNWSYSAQATYSEPISKGTYLQLSYKFQYSRSKSDRSTYDFSNLGEQFFSALTPTYRGWDSYLSLLPQDYTSYRDEALSRYSEYRNYTHDINLMFRMVREKYKFNAGVMLQPQSSHFVQDFQNHHADTTRTVVNVTPTVDLDYRFSDVSNLRLTYRGTTAQPSMTDLLDITDDSDPLNISKGNPGLKPSFTNSLNVFYNNYIEKRQQAIMTFLNFNTTRNSISNRVTYDQTTGGRISQPENINGNWDLSGALMYNTAIDSAGYWNVNTSTDYRYNNYVGYVSLGSADSQKNITRSLSLGERLAGSFRNSWLEVELDGSFTYMHTRNKLQAQSNLDTWQFAYGATVNVTLPWGTSISTDLHENSRRGYNDRSMNTNELIWNAQIAQSMLRGKRLTLSLQFYDILHNQSNFSRTVNAMQRSDTEYNSINSYAMLHVVYRFNAFGGKEARREMRRGPGGDRGPGFGGPPRGMRPPGGMRPLRF